MKQTKTELYRTCEVCGKTKHITEFRKDRSKSTGYRYTCKDCKNKYERSRIRLAKIQCILYKGGRCALCGLELSLDTLHVYEFHHLVPKDKKFTISSKGYNLNDPLVKKELKKCVLLCANGHRYAHRRK